MQLKWTYFTLNVTIVLVYLLLLCFINYHLPFSMFFKFLHDTENLFQEVEKSNEIRIEHSNNYFLSLDPLSSLELYDKRLRNGQINFAVGIISIKRANKEGKQGSHGYLLQSASAVDFMLKKAPIFNNSVGFICNVDNFPSQHQDAVKLYSYLPYVERYGKNTLSIPNLLIPNSDKSFHDVSSHTSKHQKETYDYAFCLLAAAKLKPHFILLIEDDAIPYPQFSDFLDHLMNFRLRTQNVREFDVVKFYYPAKWQGFAFSFIELCDLICFCIIGASCLCVVYICYPTPVLFINRKNIFVVGFGISLLTCYMVGRQNLNEFRRLSNFLYRMKGSEYCCTQAVLYPLNITKDLPHFMISESMNTHTDLIIADYIIDKQLKAYQIEPNLFHHAGFYSSLPLQQKHPMEFIF